MKAAHICTVPCRYRCAFSFFRDALVFVAFIQKQPITVGENHDGQHTTMAWAPVDKSVVVIGGVLAPRKFGSNL